jgi:uncharacterized NAD(P)/FAD-binding protein YdhS
VRAGPSIFRQIDEPLVRHLLSRGLARPATLGLGLETSLGLQLLRRDARPNPTYSRSIR